MWYQNKKISKLTDDLLCIVDEEDSNDKMTKVVAYRK